jgi:hypothetical protein
MYAMSWERNTRDYKYESIQHGYEVLDYQDEEPLEISLEEMLELENEEMEMEELGEIYG